MVSAMVLLLPIMLYPSTTASIDIPVNATVLNSPPVLLEVSLDSSSIDPRSYFKVRVTAGDNNTISDILSVSIQLDNTAGDNPPHVFSWTRDGFSVASGNGKISIQNSMEPQDRKSSTGIWIFEVMLPGEMASGRWELKGIVSDEEEESIESTLFWVNSFISIALSEPTSINLSVPPGQISGDASTHIFVSYTSNEEVELLITCTPFVGTTDNSFVLEPSSFSVWKEGRVRYQLAESPISIGSYRAGAEIPIHLILTVEIPQPFYDQDYEGIISMVLRPV